MKAFSSASRLPLLEICATAGVLPQSRSEGEKARMGTAIHEHLHYRSARGVDEAVRDLPNLAIRHRLDEEQARIVAARCMAFDWSPPAGSIGELALCLMEDGTIQRVKGGQGQYEVPEGAIIPGTIDIIWSEPEPLDLSDPERPKCPVGSVLVVADYKSGLDVYVEPIEVNAQLHTLAMMAARWTGARAVMPAIVFVRKGQGDWDTPEKAYGPKWIADVEQRVRTIRLRVLEEKDAYENGRPLSPVEGRHCTYCASEASCPSKTAMLRAVIGNPPALGDARLTSEQAVWIAERLTQVANLQKRMGDALRAHVDSFGPIDLPGGLQWGPEMTPTTIIDPKKALPILQDELGDDSLGAVSIPKSGIERVVKEVHEAQGIKKKLASTMRRILQRMEAEGASVRVQKATYHAHRPKGEMYRDDWSAKEERLRKDLVAWVAAKHGPTWDTFEAWDLP